MSLWIFKSVEQALHVSFLMEILPVTSRSFMQAMMEAHMKANGTWEGSIPKERTINFGGLSPLEIRGQCAMIRASVEHHLAEPEQLAVKAHYGHQTCKEAGVRGLARYVSPMLSTAHSEAILALAWGIYGNEKQKDGLSLREVAEHYGLSKSTAQRDQQIIKKVGRDLLCRAVGSLHDRFQRGGVTENEENLQPA